MRLTFHGGARSVTGSKHLVATRGGRILLECGIFQGRREESRRKNRQFPFPPGEIDAVLLSHAHIDHAGALPALVRAGFSGPIHATAATADLCEVLLQDSAQIAERDADYLNRHRASGQPPIEPLYTLADVAATLPRLVPRAYDERFEVVPGVQAIFRDAGHILGSAQVQLDIMEAPGDDLFRLGFTGDLGRDHLPILRDPYPLDGLGALIMESTYGDRLHERGENLKARLEGVVRRTAERGGRVLIPAFAVGRTQRVVYLLHQLFNERRLPEIPIYVDSPMARRATEVFRRHPECFDREASEWLEQEDILGFRRLRYVETVEESKRLNEMRVPCIIIASSGMAEAGRILHHLAHGLEDHRNTVLLVGFCAQHTLARRLQDGEKLVRVLGNEYRVRAEVDFIGGLSTHADRDELLAYLQGMSSPPATLFLVHGEEDQSLALSATLRGAGFPHVHVPHEGETFELPAGRRVAGVPAGG
jgi:metallo-beta-lactamase family protein